MRYALLALDLDGTLLGPGGVLTERNRRAVHAAREAGMRVVICTGRGLVECREYVRLIGQTDPVVVAGGAIIADPSNGRTLHRFPVKLDLVHRVVRHLVAQRHPALVLKDPSEAGYDYLVVHGPERLPLDPVTEWWFAEMNVRVRYACSPDADEHPEHTVRVGACGVSSTMLRVRSELLAAANGDAFVHSFPAVVAPEHAARTPEGESMHVLELFDLNANKWTAVSRVAGDWGITPDEIVAIGDEINDVPMIRNAGLGVAMGNAVPAVRDAAKRRTSANTDDGVARAIDMVLSGEW